MSAALQDTGDFLEVPESERLDEDIWEPEDVSPDEFEDMRDVPDGEYVELSTASLDEEEE
jgi:hypothetical protein